MVALNQQTSSTLFSFQVEKIPGYALSIQQGPGIIVMFPSSTLPKKECTVTLNTQSCFTCMYSWWSLTHCKLLSSPASCLSVFRGNRGMHLQLQVLVPAHQTTASAWSVARGTAENTNTIRNSDLQQGCSRGAESLVFNSSHKSRAIARYLLHSSLKKTTSSYQKHILPLTSLC